MSDQIPITYTNQGNVQTTALLLAFEMVRSTQKSLDADVDVVKRVADAAFTLISAMPRRAEPDDPMPGCAEPKGETCDGTPGRRNTGREGR